MWQRMNIKIIINTITVVALSLRVRVDVALCRSLIVLVRHLLEATAAGLVDVELLLYAHRIGVDPQQPFAVLELGLDVGRGSCPCAIVLHFVHDVDAVRRDSSG